MNTIILILLSLSLISSVLIIYLNFKSKNESHDEKENQEIQRLNQEIINLKESLNTTINSTMSSMATSFNNLSSLSFYPLIVGLFTSFLSSLFAIYFLVNYFSSNGLKIFILYRVVFGVLILLN